MSLEAQLQTLSKPGLLGASDRIIGQVITQEKGQEVHKRLDENYPALGILTAYIFHQHLKFADEDTRSAYSSGAAYAAIALTEYAETANLEKHYREVKPDESSAQPLSEELASISPLALMNYYINNLFERSGDDDTSIGYMFANLDEKYRSFSKLTYYIADSYDDPISKEGSDLEEAFDGDTRLAFYAGTLILAATLGEYADNQRSYDLMYPATEEND
jgi:hypothetical protein